MYNGGVHKRILSFSLILLLRSVRFLQTLAFPICLFSVLLFYSSFILTAADDDDDDEIMVWKCTYNKHMYLTCTSPKIYSKCNAKDIWPLARLADWWFFFLVGVCRKNLTLWPDLTEYIYKDKIYAQSTKFAVNSLHFITFFICYT